MEQLNLSNVTKDPKLVIIGGASAGGNSACFVTLHHPEAIGNVVAQSGAFWRGVGHTAQYWDDPKRDENREGFAHAVASLATGAPMTPLRFYLTIGRLENGTVFSEGMVSMIAAYQHVRDVLQTKGFDVTLPETSGGQDPLDWDASLPDALISLLK